MHYEEWLTHVLDQLKENNPDDMFRQKENSKTTIIYGTCPSESLILPPSFIRKTGENGENAIIDVSQDGAFEYVYKFSIFLPKRTFVGHIQDFLFGLFYLH